MEKVWNLTDDPRTEGPGITMMLFGKSVLPGRCVKVPEDMVKASKKIQVDIDAGRVAVGRRPPQGYLDAKAPPKAVRPAGSEVNHKPTTDAPVEEVKESPKPEPKKPSVKVEEPSDEPAEDNSEEDSKEKDPKPTRRRRSSK